MITRVTGYANVTIRQGAFLLLLAGKVVYSARTHNNEKRKKKGSTMSKTITKQEFLNAAGAEYGPGEWFKVTQERINQFADATDDHQFIHIDPETAKKTPFGGTIAHGFLTLSLLAHLVPQISPKPENVQMGVNYGMNKLRFLNPVKVDSEIRVKSKVLEVVEKKPGQILTTTEVTVEIKGETVPALITEWLGMTFVGE